MSLSLNKIIKLDVGGIRYKTTLNTLLSYPESMLSNMFSSKHKLNDVSDGYYFIDMDRELNIDSDGYYFIDRDGEIFKYIIKFLRDKTLNLDSLSDSIIRDIITEAKYYNISDLVVLCEKKINKYQNTFDVCSVLLKFDINEFSREFNIIFSPDMLAKYDCNNTFINQLDENNHPKNFVVVKFTFKLYEFNKDTKTIVFFPSLDNELNQEKKQALNFIKKWIQISGMEQYKIDNGILCSTINTNLINHPYHKIKCHFDHPSYSSQRSMILEFFYAI
jgi:hypothetical protein